MESFFLFSFSQFNLDKWRHNILSSELHSSVSNSYVKTFCGSYSMVITLNLFQRLNDDVLYSEKCTDAFSIQNFLAHPVSPNNTMLSINLRAISIVAEGFQNS